MKFKYFIIALFTIFISTGAYYSYNLAFAKETGKQQITIEGIVANDFFDSEPKTYDEALELAANDPSERTGWSIKFYACDASQIGQPNGSSQSDSPWREQRVVVTDDSGRDKKYDVSDYSSQIIAAYGQKVYDDAVKSGGHLTYDSSKGKHMVNSTGDTGIPLPCNDGDLGFYYNNMEFYLTMTFEVDNKKPDGCVEEINGEDCTDKPSDLTGCIDDPASCEPIKPFPPKKPDVPNIGNGDYCPQPYIPGQIEEPFIYEMDLITERIEGKTVDKGKTTMTPVTVYRADFSNERTTIKDGLKEDLKNHQEMLVECQQIIAQFERELADLQRSLELVQAAYSACLNSGYWDSYEDDDGDEHWYWVEPDCSEYPPQISALQTAIAEKREQIRLAKITLSEIEEVIAAILDYIATIETLEDAFKVIPTTVDLNVNGTTLQTKPVALAEDMRKVLEYSWVLEKDSKVEGFIDPQDNYKLCDGSLIPCETIETNNYKETPIYISTRETVDACTIDGSYSELQGIVRTIQEGDSPETVENVYERVKSKIVIDSEEKNRRAGYGFYYNVEVEYENDDIALDRETKGVDNLEAFKPEILASHLPYEYNNWATMKTSSTQVDQNKLTLQGYNVKSYEQTFNETKEMPEVPYTEKLLWELPHYSVEAYSGNVFEGNIGVAESNPNRNHSDTLLDGGRKWYLDFYQPDGIYAYQVLIEDIGVNRLTLCNEGQVTVKGTWIGDENDDSDFVFRYVDPSNPFPSGVGWNWQGFESTLTQQSEWWLTYPYKSPNEVPNNFHEAHFKINH